MSDTKAIRAELKKELGYNARMVSVKGSYSRITFTIRLAEIKKSEVEAFAVRYESYQRDYATGEILCGGNTFVTVEYSEEIKKELVSSVIDNVEKAISEIEDNCLIPVEGTKFMVGKDYRGISVWENKDFGSCITTCCNSYYTALVIAAA